MLFCSAHLRLRLFQQQMISHHQRINVGEHEATVGIIWCAHNRFTSDVKTGIDYHRAAGGSVKLIHHRVKEPVTFRIYCLNSGGVIYMRDRGDQNCAAR